MTTTETTAIPLQCGHSREIAAADAATARRNGWLYCPDCQRKREVQGDGSDYKHPLVLAGRDELDLTQLRQHVREMHSPKHDRRHGRRVPRSNRDLAPWHWGQHHRYHQGHHHGGPVTLVRDARGRTVGQIPRPLGWYTGQEPKTREQVRDEFLDRMAARKGGT